MIDSVYSKDFSDFMKSVKNQVEKEVNVGSNKVKIKTPFHSPEDWRDEIIYFIMIDRFNNSDSAPKSQWDTAYNGFQGGTFRGICDKLDYIKSLGVTSIWLTPVFKNCIYENTYYGYGIQDFLTVDPRYGTEEELTEFIDQAHARGMHVILDIVLNHTGEVFKYDLGQQDTQDQPFLSNSPYNILWRDKVGTPRWSAVPQGCGPNEGVWPIELQKNEYFYRLGNGNAGDDNCGDFFTLRKINADYVGSDGKYPVRDILIKAYQYAIAKFDCDGFRIDTLKYISSNFAHLFGNAIREFALNIGKKNFFTFGEIYDNEFKISQYIGRNTNDMDGITGVDAALDFPLFYVLPGVIKASIAPSEIARMFSNRSEVERTYLSSHGEAGRYFVTFIDNHDQEHRFYSSGYEEQLKIGVGALITLQGISCIYYGTEQGLHGIGGMDYVREALWGKSNAFDTQNEIFNDMQTILKLHANEPAIRYGRQYFRPVSGDGCNYGISTLPGGILSFSRILNDEEVLIIINTNTQNAWSGYVVVDDVLNPESSVLQMLYSNLTKDGTAIAETKYNSQIYDLNGNVSTGNIRSVYVSLKPMEMQVLKRVV